MKAKKRKSQLEARRRDWSDTINRGSKDDGKHKRMKSGGYREPGSLKMY